MGEPLYWLLAGLALCLLAGWLGYRAVDRSEAKRRTQRAIAEAAARAAVDEALARRQESQRAAAQKAALAEAARLAREQAVHDEAERAAAARVAEEQAALEQATLQQAARRAAAEASLAQAARAAAQREERLREEPAAPAPAAARPPAAIAVKAPEQTVVMVADDSKVVRIKTGRLLEQHRYRVIYAADGLDAARQMQASAPDILITDVEMPGMDGFGLTRHVRQNALTARLPVIMITAADDKHRDEAKAAGVSVLLGKPYPEDELIAHIRHAMNPAAADCRALADNAAGGSRSELDAMA
jgi:CheY-like chemotaxis protein